MGERIAMVLGFCLMAGCAGKAWREAQVAHTGEAYRTFATENPDHRKVPEALRRAEERDWTAARELDTPEAYFAYLGAYPRGPHAVDAQALAEERAWARTQAENTPESLSAFVARFPLSTRADQAKAMMEAAWYERAVAEGTEEAWSRYLVRYPEGEFVATATAERERLAWEATVDRGTRRAYEAFAARYPRSSHRPEALAWIRQSQVVRLQPVVVLGTAESTGADDRVALAKAVRRELDASLLYDLERDFRLKRTIMVDLRGGPAPHPQDAYPVERDTGLLVLTYRDERGREFEPSGHATDVAVDLALYAPVSRDPIWSTTFEATTPDAAYGNSERALRDAALAEMGSLLRGYSDEIAEERRRE